MIGKREIPINKDEGVFEIYDDKIPITQNLINLISMVMMKILINMMKKIM
jgi:hypothetical protein